MRKEPIRAILVDDEPLARQTLRILLEKDPEVEVVGECRNGREAVDTIRAESPDLVFLDIQMPEMDGFEVLERIDAREVPAVVFVTAYDRYALQAFDVRAIDYLLKPFTDARFHRALELAKREIEQRELIDLGRRFFDLLEERDRQAASSRSEAYLSRILIRSADRVCFVPVRDIDWVEAAGSYVELHVGRKSHLLRETMNALEAQLDSDRFVRIHRSTIVNIDRILELRPDAYGDYHVVLSDGTELKLSRGRREVVEQRLSYGTAGDGTASGSDQQRNRER